MGERKVVFPNRSVGPPEMRWGPLAPRPARGSALPQASGDLALDSGADKGCHVLTGGERRSHGGLGSRQHSERHDLLKNQRPGHVGDISIVDTASVIGDTSFQRNGDIAMNAPTNAPAFKRRQRVATRYAMGDRVDVCTVVRYQDMENVPGRPDLKGLTGWWVVRHEDGSMSSCHESMMRAV